MNQTLISLLGVVALLGYVAIALRMIHFAKYWQQNAKEQSIANYLSNPLDTVLVYALILVHLIYVFNIMLHSEYAIDMGLLKMLNLTFLFMFLTVRLFVVRFFSALIFFVIVVINIAVLSIDVLWLSVQTEKLVSDYAIVSHALISILSYSLCGLVILQTIIFSLQEAGLKSRRSWVWFHFVPALENNEKLFYDLSRIAFIGLSLSILSGIVVLDDWFAQQVSHKTIFTFLAWIVFGGLLWFRKRYTVTPQQSSRYALWACSLLMIGVVGSKVVLEFILS